MKKKTILIAGHTGLIGRAMASFYKDQKILTAGRDDFLLSDKDFIRKYETADIIMNFAGTPVIKRWTAKNKNLILQSRLQTTKKIGNIINQGKGKQRHYLGASAIGIYADKGIHTEKSKIRGEGFLTEVVEELETEIMKLEGDNTIVSVLRIGIVLSKEGGMLHRMSPFFRIGLGGKIGNGKQAFSWIHIHDLVKASEHIINKKGGGIYNIVSPEISSNKNFTKELGIVLNKPAYLTIPEIALKVIFGKAAVAISGGQSVLPDRLIKEGLVFEYPELRTALEEIVN